MAFVNCAYDGIDQVRRFRFTTGHDGVCVCMLEIRPQINIPAINGTLFLTDGLTTLTVPGCRLDRSNLSFSMSGHVVQVRILGPTWKWQIGCIDGVYNARRADGSFQEGTEKTPSELAELLFQSMNVSSFSTTNLPPEIRPFVNWKGSPSISELKALCLQCGCGFGLDVHTGVASIWRLGIGANLPTGNEQTVDYGTDFSETPDYIKIYCGPTLYQLKFLLEPVMKDKDDSWKPANEVSYAPPNGWDGVDPFDPLPGSQDEEAVKLAKRWLWRAWRVKDLADESMEVPTYGPIQQIEDLYPLFDRLSDNYENDAGVYEDPAYLEGTIAIDSTGGDVAAYENTDDFTLIEVPHRLDSERGIVISSAPLIKLDDDDQWVAADVYYVATCHIRNPETFDSEYYSITRQIAQNGTGTLPVHRPDLVRRVVILYDDETPNGTDDNSQELDQQLSAQADAVQSQFQVVQSTVKTYKGLIPIRLDGAIRQVTYHGSCYGREKGFRTTAARNTEWEYGIPSEKRRRRNYQADSAGVTRDIHEHERHVRHRKGDSRRW